MHMSRVRLDPSRMAPATLSHLLGGGGYHLHQALWNLFENDPDTERDFLYRHEYGDRAPTFLLLSKREPADRDGCWTIETKPYHPRIQVGDQLGFSVRINPIVAKRDESGKQHRHDVVMNRKKALKESGEEFTQTEVIQEATEQWFATREARSGFRLAQTSLLAEGYQQHRLSRGRGKPVRFSTVDVSGRLTVTDSDSFLDVAMDGLGPAKAFGCGLLLIRRV